MTDYRINGLRERNGIDGGDPRVASEVEELSRGASTTTALTTYLEEEGEEERRRKR